MNTAPATNHEFLNSNDLEFDANCSTCGGKQRDAIHRLDAPTCEHTATPWRLEDNQQIYADKGIVWVSGDGTTNAEDCANAAFIVRAVNNHEALVAALQVLRDATSQHTCNGGGSNCNKCLALDSADAALSTIDKEGEK